MNWTDLLQWIFFGLFAALVLGGALGMTVTMSMYRAGISLMISLVAMAGLFVLLEADMLAVIQVMMNVGGMLVMTFFMVMLMQDPGGEMMWDMKRAMRMPGFAAFSMTMPPRPKETGNARASPPPAEPASAEPETREDRAAMEHNTMDMAHEARAAMEHNTMDMAHSDPRHTIRAMHRAMAVMQQQLGIMQQQLVALEEQLEGQGEGQLAASTTAMAGMPTEQIGPQPATVYTCPMHPEVRMGKPGQCPKCGMDLVPAESGDADSMNMGNRPAEPPAKEGSTVYTCPMHSEVRSDTPGRCPKCGMDLVPADDGGAAGGSGSSSTGSHGGMHTATGGMEHGGGTMGSMAHGDTGHGTMTAAQMQRRDPRGYYKMMAGMAMSTGQLRLAGVFSAVAGLVLVFLIARVAWPSRPVATDLDGPTRVGDLLLSDYMIGFEGAAFLILLGILGAVLLARREKTREAVRKGAH